MAIRLLSKKKSRPYIPKSEQEEFVKANGEYSPTVFYYRIPDGKLRDLITEKTLSLEMKKSLILKGKSMSSDEILDALTSTEAGQKSMLEMSRLSRLIVRGCLKNWENLRCEDGEEIPFSTDDDGLVSRDIFDDFDENLIEELASAITEKNEVTIEELGKSLSLLKSPQDNCPEKS
jgi:hypothetical protein